MDPNANIKRQREIATAILAYFGMPVDAENPDDIAELSQELSELTNAMNIWIITGGSKPKDWTLSDAYRNGMVD